MKTINYNNKVNNENSPVIFSLVLMSCFSRLDICATFRDRKHEQTMNNWLVDLSNWQRIQLCFI